MSLGPDWTAVTQPFGEEGGNLESPDKFNNFQT